MDCEPGDRSQTVKRRRPTQWNSGWSTLKNPGILKVCLVQSLFCTLTAREDPIVFAYTYEDLRILVVSPEHQTSKRKKPNDQPLTSIKACTRHGVEEEEWQRAIGAGPRREGPEGARPDGHQLRRARGGVREAPRCSLHRGAA